MKHFLLFGIGVILVGCGTNPASKNDVASMIDLMKDIPCHQMGGQWMGDCQQDGGLYGDFWVEPSATDYWAEVSKEVTWILDDLSLEAYDKTQVNHTPMGRFGSVMLLNNEENYQTTAKVGETVRYFITNTANVRPFNLKIKGAQIKLMGGDLGRIEQEKLVDSVLIAPAERWIIEVYYPTASTYAIEHVTPDKTYRLGEVVVTGKTVTEFQTSFNFKVQ